MFMDAGVEDRHADCAAFSHSWLVDGKEGRGVCVCVCGISTRRTEMSRKRPPLCHISGPVFASTGRLVALSPADRTRERERVCVPLCRVGQGRFLLQEFSSLTSPRDRRRGANQSALRFLATHADQPLSASTQGRLLISIAAGICTVAASCSTREALALSFCARTIGSRQGVLPTRLEVRASRAGRLDWLSL